MTVSERCHPVKLAAAAAARRLSFHPSIDTTIGYFDNGEEAFSTWCREQREQQGEAAQAVGWERWRHCCRRLDEPVLPPRVHFQAAGSARASHQRGE